jgi:stage V sporulation protein G
MEVGNVRVFRVNNEESRIRAFASVVVGDECVITGIQVVQGERDTYIRMPSRKSHDGRWKEFVIPNEHLRRRIRDAVLTAYMEAPERKVK